MKVVPFRAEHLAQMGSRWIRSEDAAALEGPWTLTGMVDGQVLICGGGVEVWPGRWQVWTEVSEAARPRWKTVHRAARNFLTHLRTKARRIEAHVPCDFEAGQRWAQYLGFTLEKDRMPKFLPDGSDAAMYVIVKEN